VKYINRGLLTGICLIITGCGAAQYIKTSYTDDSCLVHVFRDDFTLIYSFDVVIDKKTYAKLNDQSYTDIYLPAGEYVITANWFPGSGGVDLDVPITCSPKETLNIAFTGHIEGAPGGGMRRKIMAGKLTDDAAKRRMETYKKVGE